MAQMPRAASWRAWMAADLGPRLPAAVAAGRGARQERSRISLPALLASPASDRPRAGLRPARPRSHICVIGVNLRPAITPNSADIVHVVPRPTLSHQRPFVQL